MPDVTSADLTFSDRAEAALARAEESESWSEVEVRQAAKDHVMTTWSATRPSLEAYPVVVRTDGVYFYTSDGKKMIDFSSQAMCTNLGDSMPDEIMQAIIHQMKTAPMIWGEASLVPIRSQLSRLLADMCPGDINKFIYTSSGAEANEAAIRAARLYTGRRKILARYKSYHGSTAGCLSLTGDYRRVFNEPMDPSVRHFHCPYPYAFKWSDTDDPKEICEKSLAYFRETLQHEGPETVAAVYIESVTGTNGVLAPPPGYLEGIRELCDQHGILMVCDEVMAGFGRTGRLFGFSHSAVIPDLVTFAKGVNGSFLPLGGMGMRDHVAEHFQNNPLWSGGTYNGHPVALASAYASLKYALKNKIFEQVLGKGEILKRGLDELQAKHPCIKQNRVVGLFGGFDLQKNLQGDYFSEVHVNRPELGLFKKTLNENGAFTVCRGHFVFANPPLIISEDEINEGIDALDRSLHVFDNAME